MEPKHFYKYTNANAFKIKSQALKNIFKTNLQSGFRQTGWYLSAAFVKNRFHLADTFISPTKHIYLIYSTDFPKVLTVVAFLCCRWCVQLQTALQEWLEALAPLYKQETNTRSMISTMSQRKSTSRVEIRTSLFLPQQHYTFQVHTEKLHDASSISRTQELLLQEMLLYFFSKKLLVYLSFCFTTFCL